MASKDGTNMHAHRPQRSTKRPHSSIPYVNLDDYKLAKEILREPPPPVANRKKKPKPSPSPLPPSTSELGSGCFVCGLDNDHSNLLICEACNGEFHTYCLSPPLRAVPKNEWFCDKCKQGDDLNSKIASLPDSFTSRFGEIVWAQGGVGYGWWPACIYDPRLTLGSARMQAIKYLGKKHLVYFFECKQAPFELLPENKIMEWEFGFMEDCHLGKSAKATRLSDFHCAIHAASIEENKTRDRRLDWNHQGTVGAQQSQPSPERHAEANAVREPNNLSAARGDNTNSRSRGKAKKRQSTNDGDLYCKVFFGVGAKQQAPIGFVRTRSRLKSTFAHLRRVIENDLVPDVIKADWDWRFLVPNLGPLSKAQETKFGPALPFLQQASTAGGDGTSKSPLQVDLVEAPKPTVS